MPNTYKNKVVYNGTTLIDLTADTAVASDVAQGKYFHLASGERVAGTASGGGGGDTYTRTVVVPQQTFTAQELYGSYQTVISYIDGIEDGEYYLVTFDGDEYACECGLYWGSDYMAGHVDTFWGGLGEHVYPFGLDYVPSANEMSVGAFDLNQHTIKVEHLEFVDGPLNLIAKSVTANGTYNASSDNADGYSSVTVNVPSGGGTYQAKTNISPSTSSQTITPDSGYDALSSVQINAMPTGTAGTPSATKGSVSNHSVSVTPSVTNQTGYITGSTKTGTAVTVSASELVSGSETKTANGTYDVTNLAQLVVNVASGGGGIGTLLNTTTIGTVNTTSTQAASLNVSCEVSGVDSYDLLIVESSVNTKTNGRHAATIGLIFLTASSAIGTKSGGTIATAKLNVKLASNGTATSSTSTTAYGIYPNSVSVSNGTATIPMYRRYNSTSTGTINGTYTTRVYGVNLYDLIGG